MKVIIPLAGKGTRLRPHTHVTPKPMIRIAGKPVIDYVMDDLQKLGAVDQVIYITGHLKEKVEEYTRAKYPFDSVFIEQLTWMEVRDAMKAGKTTVIIPTGGVEQNGPYLATGKHNYILRATTEAIARKLGNALVAPIVVFVPEGDIDPPSLHMKYPGTISLTGKPC